MLPIAILSAILLAEPAVVPAPADSVRELHMAVVVYTRSFARTLDAAQIERLQEEIVEFAEFYRFHGGDRVAFRFTLVQLDRELRRHEVGEVAPGRYYLSREDVSADLHALGLDRAGVDEVVAFYAWDNANADGAALAYGGGAVGPDGNFLGDAGFNSIGVFAFDPARIAQIAIHEVLHNVDDMFSRAGMPDGFLNSDEMSRNMERLVAERPGAFEPYFSDAEMLAYAERERAGRDAYPWWMQRVYYAWMLERTPAAAWAALRHGRMLERRDDAGVRPLYDEMLVSRATGRIYLPALVTAADEAGPTAAGGALTARQWTLEDFDGSAITSGTYLGGWIDLTGADSVAAVMFGDARMIVHRLPLGDIAVPARAAAGVDDPAATFEAVARAAGWPEPGQVITAATVTAMASGTTTARGTGRVRVPLPAAAGTSWIVVDASAPGFVFPQARVEVVREAAWRIEVPATREASMGSPLGLRVEVRQHRPLEARVVARLPGGGAAVLTRAPDGSYHGSIEGLPPGLHTVELIASRPAGDVVVDTLRVYARPSGWIRVPRRLESTAGEARFEASVRTRMGATSMSALPLVAVVGPHVVPLDFERGSYDASLALPAGEHRLYVTSLTGDFQRRLILASVRGGAGPVAAGAVDDIGGVRFIAAPRMDAEPVLDGVADVIHGQRPARIGPSAHLLTDASAYGGAADLDARLAIAWREDGLYVSGEVRDDDVTGGEAWDRDRINMVFDWREDTTPLTYATDSPPTSEWQRDDYWVFFQPFDAEGSAGGVRAIGREGQRTLTGARLASRRTSDGYTFELWLPAAELPEFVPFEAQVAGLQLFISDGDAGQPLAELMWSDAWGWSRDGGLSWELSRMGRLIFAGVPLR